MSKRLNVFLTGLMGSGKSRVGRQVATILKMEFVDTDSMIENKMGQTINEIFAAWGEGFFREKEAALLAALVESGNQVVATGGGMLANSANLKLALASGFVVYLKAGPDLLAKRLAEATDRPLLDDADPAAKLAQLLESRRGYYEAAHLTLNVNELDIDQAAARIAEEYRVWLAE